HITNYLPLRKLLHEHLHAVYFVSDDGRNYSLKKIPDTTEKKFRVAKLGVPPAATRNPDAPSAEFVVVSCSRLEQIKRVDRIGEILSRLKNLPIRWIHFGGGILQESILKQSVRWKKE